MSILPGTQAPDLAVETVGGDTWQLSLHAPKNFTLLVFYRGHH